LQQVSGQFSGVSKRHEIEKQSRWQLWTILQSLEIEQQLCGNSNVQCFQFQSFQPFDMALALEVAAM